MKTRPFQLSDYAAVTELLQTSLSVECYEDTMEAFARQLSWDGGLVYVCETDQGIVGAVIGTIDNNDGYYYRVAVHPLHRRQGIGKALINSLKDRFQQRKVKRILIPVDTHNEPVLPLYESLGYGIQHFTKSFNKLSILTGS
jgi:ribosomal protein S18 acetylase RimI-like enzyme